MRKPLQQLCSDLDRGMPSKAKRAKEQKWKLARNAVWGCVPARLGSEVPATWVPAIGGSSLPLSWDGLAGERVVAGTRSRSRTTPSLY